MKYFLDPQLKKLSEEKFSEWRTWFDSRLDNAIEATEIENQLENAESM
jgi:optic atrophy protein 1